MNRRAKKLPELDITLGIKQLQKTISNTNTCVSRKISCQCDICLHPLPSKTLSQPPTYSTASSDLWLYNILKAITPIGFKTIQMYIPFICFPTTDGVQFYYSNKKQCRVIRLPGVIPQKYLFSTILHLRKEYKSTLEHSFQQQMVQAFDPNFIHARYQQIMLPRMFHDGSLTSILQSNKSKFKNYIFHTNDIYTMGSIQQHKSSHKELFCRYRLKDGYCQIANQEDIKQLITLKGTQNISYIQSYIKPKQQAQQFYESQYDSSNISIQLYQKAQRLVILLLDTPYNQRSEQLSSLEDEAYNLMKISTEDYINEITYQIVHYLSMASRVFVKKLKLRWMINDIGHLYMQEVLYLETNKYPTYPLKYSIPPIITNQDFFRSSKQFIEVHRQNNPQKHKIPQLPKLTTHKKNQKVKLQRLSKTIEVLKKDKQQKTANLHHQNLAPRLKLKLQKSTAISINTIDLDQ